MKTTTIRLPDNLHKQIRQAALDSDTSMNAWILRALGTKVREGNAMKNNLKPETIQIYDESKDAHGLKNPVSAYRFSEIKKHYDEEFYSKKEKIAEGKSVEEVLSKLGLTETEVEIEVARTVHLSTTPKPVIIEDLGNAAIVREKGIPGIMGRFLSIEDAKESIEQGNVVYRNGSTVTTKDIEKILY